MTAAFPDGPCMHEALFDDAWLEGTDVSTLDLAKALIDEGFHPMTVYFPTGGARRDADRPLTRTGQPKREILRPLLRRHAGPLRPPPRPATSPFQVAPFRAPLRHRLDETRRRPQAPLKLGPVTR